MNGNAVRRSGRSEDRQSWGFAHGVSSVHRGVRKAGGAAPITKTGSPLTRPTQSHRCARCPSRGTPRHTRAKAGVAKLRVLRHSPCRGQPGSRYRPMVSSRVFFSSRRRARGPLRPGPLRRAHASRARRAARSAPLTSTATRRPARPSASSNAAIVAPDARRPRCPLSRMSMPRILARGVAELHAPYPTVCPRSVR